MMSSFITLGHLTRGYIMGHATGKQLQEKRDIIHKQDIKASEALALRREGLTYTAIAIRTGYNNRSSCSKAVRRLLAAEYSVTMEEAKFYKQEEVARLDDMMAKLYPRLGLPVIKIVRGQEVIDDDHDIFTVDRILKIMERRAKLLGLDAPTRTDNTHTMGMSHEEALKELDDTVITVEVETIPDDGTLNEPE